MQTLRPSESDHLCFFFSLFFPFTHSKDRAFVSFSGHTEIPNGVHINSRSCMPDETVTGGRKVPRIVHSAVVECSFFFFFFRSTLLGSCYQIVRDLSDGAKRKAKPDGMVKAPHSLCHHPDECASHPVIQPATSCPSSKLLTKFHDSGGSIWGSGEKAKMRQIYIYFSWKALKCSGVHVGMIIIEPAKGEKATLAT